MGNKGDWAKTVSMSKSIADQKVHKEKKQKKNLEAHTLGRKCGWINQVNLIYIALNGRNVSQLKACEGGQEQPWKKKKITAFATSKKASRLWKFVNVN